jgi:Tfp pilus assembly protein PilV
MHEKSRCLRPAVARSISSMPTPHALHRLAENAGFGLIDTLIALTLLAVSLLGVSGGVHYALRATHATLLQTQAVDLIADLTEDLHWVNADDLPALLSGWQVRVQQALPARDFAPPRLTRVSAGSGAHALAWLDVEMGWNGLAGTRDGALSLPVTTPGSENLP